MARNTSSLLLITILVAAVAAGAETWTVAAGSEVGFRSEAPMESFEGETDQVTGHLTCDPGVLVGPVELRFAVDLASIDTGIGMRNTHMRERHLETDNYPEAIFTGEEVLTASAPALKPGQEVELIVRGTFEVHGVAHPRDITAVATLNEDGSLDVASRFLVSLKEHEIDRPQFLFMKLADEQKVRVQLRLRPEGS